MWKLALCSAAVVLMAIGFGCSSSTDTGPTPPAACTNCDSLTSVADNTMWSSDSLSSGVGSFMFAGRSDGTAPNNGDSRRALVRFDVSNLPAGATITSVELRLQMNKAKSGSGSPDVSLHKLTKTWGEGASKAPDGKGATALVNDVTWWHNVFQSQRWTTPGGDFVLAASATLAVDEFAGFYRWSGTAGSNNAAMVADVQDWFDNPGNNHGWLLLGDETTTGTARSFSTKDVALAGLRPLLVVHYTP